MLSYYYWKNLEQKKKFNLFHDLTVNFSRGEGSLSWSSCNLADILWKCDLHYLSKSFSYSEAVQCYNCYTEVSHRTAENPEETIQSGKFVVLLQGGFFGFMRRSSKKLNPKGSQLHF